MCAKHGFPVEFPRIYLCVREARIVFIFSDQLRMEKQISVIHTRSYLLVNRIQLFLFFFFVFRHGRKFKKKDPPTHMFRTGQSNEFVELFRGLCLLRIHTQTRHIHLQPYTKQLRYQRRYSYTVPYDFYGILFSARHHRTWDSSRFNAQNE